MNLLLIEQAEINGDSVTLRDRRALHLTNVLKVQLGDTIKAGIINFGTVKAQVLSIVDETVTLNLRDAAPSNIPDTHVVLAIPRPKAVSRIVQSVSSFGVASISLINAWKVEKSYLSSPRLSAHRLREDAILGCEQGRQCHLPSLQVLSQFRDFLKQQETAFARSCLKIALDPEVELLLPTALNFAAEMTTQVAPVSAVDRSHSSPPGFTPAGVSPASGIVLALGPEGGFIPRELESLAHYGYIAARLNVGPLRTETAVTAALGVLTTTRHYAPTHLP